MSHPSTAVPTSLSVSLTRRATTAKLEGSPRNYNHYNLKRVTREFSSQELVESDLWYRKTSANLEIQATTADNCVIPKRLSHIPAPKLIRRLSFLPDELGLKTTLKKTDIENENEMEKESVLPRVMDASPSNIRPCTKLGFCISSLNNICCCVEKTETKINYAPNTESIHRILSAPLFECFENRAGIDEVSPIRVRQSRVSCSSIYSEDENATSSLPLLSDLSVLQLPDRPLSRELENMKKTANVFGTQNKHRSFACPSLGLDSKLLGQELLKSYRRKTRKGLQPSKLSDQVQIRLRKLGRPTLQSYFPRVLSNLKKNAG